MLMSLFKKGWPFFFVLFAAVSVTVFVSHPVAGVPALGPLLSPFTGFWQNAPVHLIQRQETFDWPELKSPVIVEWDEYGVPHIFAQNEHDLFMAQGFVHARHRLFQMEITSRAGEGRLSELLGDNTMSTDLFFVRLGMRSAIQRTLDSVLADSETREAMTAYEHGVNRYIDGLSAHQVPVEYKLLGAEPRRWSVRHSAAIFMVMTFRLSGRSYDLFLTRHAQKHGWEKLKPLFPQFLSEDLIVPYPKGANTLPQGDVETGFDNPFIASVSLDMADEFIQPFATNGSNNWAFSGLNSKDGHTWLANDTHLSYSLPAIFYEQQLITPEFNVYGASIIGSAGLQIGFHESMGWAVTNGNTDVLDWYEVEFEEEYSDKYLFNGQFLELKKTTDTVSSRSGQDVIVTHEWGEFGKVYSRRGTLGLAFRWMGHNNKNELKTFLNLTRARSHEECVRAVVHYHVPIQNLICAGPQQLSIVHMGRSPIRTGYSGSMVKDGRNTDPEWQRLLDYDEMPQTHGPDKGYVFSANQRIAPKHYKYYLSWDFEESYRAMQIKKGLEAMNASPDFEKFQKLQNETFNPQAAEFLPYLLEALITKDLEPLQVDAVKELGHWSYHARIDSWEMSLFHFWWEHFEEELYKNQLGSSAKNAYPKVRRTLQLVRDLLKKPESIQPDHYWFLGVGTNREKLQLRMVQKINDSFQKTWRQLSLAHGDRYQDWLWKHSRPTTVPHVLKIPAFSSRNVEKSGGRYTVDVNTGAAGAVWRHIARIGENFEAWTNYPGGPSGNPFSRMFDSQVSPWAADQYRKVHFLKKPMPSEDSP